MSLIAASESAGTTVGAHGTLLNCVSAANGQTLCNGIRGLATFLIVFGLIYLAILVIFIIAYVKILNKAGYSGWWLLIGFVPLVGMVMFFVFAFSKWPVERELEMLRVQTGGGGGYATPYGYPAGPGPWEGGYGSGFQPQGPFPSSGPGFQSATPGYQVTETKSPEQANLEPRLPPFTQGRPDAPVHRLGPETGAEETAWAQRSTGRSAPGGQPPAGWYPVPDGRRRYWDGAAWTDHFA